MTGEITQVPTETAAAPEKSWATRARIGGMSQPSAFLDEIRQAEMAEKNMPHDASALNDTQRTLDRFRKEDIAAQKESVGFGGRK